VMFLDEAAGKQPALESSFGIKLSLAASGLATLAIGIFPEPVVRFAQTSLFK
jgi:NADH:ubiquinone oxidoreductase subunit 2 (subunit N)